MSMTIERLDPDRPSDCAALVRIYQAAIERSEQKPESTLRELLRDYRYDVLLARAPNGQVSGFSMVFHPSTRDFWLLEYMAVNEDSRGLGHGAQLFARASALAASRVPMAPGLLEVDLAPANSGSDDVRAKRLRFYARLGCRRLAGLDYILPIEMYGTPPPMMLLVTDPISRSHWPVAMVESWLETLYEEVYGQRLPDLRISRMRATLAEPVPVVEIE